MRVRTTEVIYDIIRRTIVRLMIMPNHLHGILFFNKPDKSKGHQTSFGSQSQNLGSVIRSFKSSLKRYANQNNIDFAWQNGYYDRIIRNERELNNVSQYIADNPDKWAFDNLYNP